MTGPVAAPDRTHPRRRWRRRAAVALAGVVLVVAPACGDDDGAASSPDAGSTEGSTAEGPAAALGLADLADASGDAPATSGADLPQDPGASERRGLPGAGETAASITAADGTVQGCCLLVAADEEVRQRGLMEVTDLGGYTGMVFVWDEDSSGGFWMRNTPMPLSIAFFDADGAFVASDDMEPCDDSPDCPVYPSPGTYRFAVEVPRGDLADLGVGPGSRLALGGACARTGVAP